MKKYEILRIIKEANQIVDEMAKYSVSSHEYESLSLQLGYTLDALYFNKNRYYSVHLSKRTGHYYVRFA